MHSSQVTMQSTLLNTSETLGIPHTAGAQDGNFQDEVPQEHMQDQFQGQDET